MQRGVIASLAASVLFGVLFFLPSLTAPLDENSIFAWRIFITLPLVVAAPVSYTHLTLPTIYSV